MLNENIKTLSNLISKIWNHFGIFIWNVFNQVSLPKYGYVNIQFEDLWKTIVDILVIIA